MESKNIDTINDNIVRNEDTFSYGSFFRSIMGFINPILSSEYFKITTLFLYKDDSTNRIYGKYTIRHNIHPDKTIITANAVRFLNEYKLFLDDPANESFSVYKIYNNFLSFNIKDIKQESLDEYFPSIKYENSSGNFPSPYDYFSRTNYNDVPKTTKNFKDAELILVEDLMGNFPPNDSYYLPLPIISRGELVGMIYFVYDKSKLKDDLIDGLLSYYRLLILNITREYERVTLFSKLLKYAEKPENPLTGYEYVFADLDISTEELMLNENHKNKKIITSNKFLTELGYGDYYKSIGPVLIQESKQILLAERFRIKTAIAAILVDSHAHNIGSHSLSVLRWFFETRYKILDRPIQLGEDLTLQINYQIPNDLLKEYGTENQFYVKMGGRSERALSNKDVSLIDIIYFMTNIDYSDLLSIKNSNDEIMTRIPVPLDYALTGFFEFLRNKSAFWSGVTRDTIFGVRQRSWVNLLRSLLNNTLFWGTIAHSEGINRINFYIEIIGDDDKIIETGEFAQIDLSILKEFQSIRNKESQESNQKYSNYAFLREGNDFKILYEVLKNLSPIFFPGEIIGQEAFSSILESTLRNIKHYRKQPEELASKGLDFYISIKEVYYSVPPRNEKPKSKSLFKIGVWLNYPQTLCTDDNPPIIFKQTEYFEQRIVDEDGNVRLGGSSLEKVCAAMLLNNNFESIELIDAAKHPHYHPYIYAASEPYRPKRQKGDLINDDYINGVYCSKSYDSNQMKDYYKQKNKAEAKGIIKKYFHTWMGENCFISEDIIDSKYNNPARHRIVAVKSQGIIPKLNIEGIIRVITVDDILLKIKEESITHSTEDSHGNENSDIVYRYAMTSWLQTWLKRDLWSTQSKENDFHSESKNNLLHLRISKFMHEDEQTIGYVCIKIDEKNRPYYKYYNQHEFQKGIETQELDKKITLESPKLIISHGGTFHDKPTQGKECRVRNHTSFLNHVFPDGEISIKEIQKVDSSKVKAAKLIETVNTHITIIDNRIHSRLRIWEPNGDNLVLNPDYFHFSRMLNLNVFPEIETIFQSKGKELIGLSHFIIIHLSFLETIIKDEKSQIRYKESEVEAFFEKEIKQKYMDYYHSDLPKNFFLVITSGRGRSEWVPKDRVKSHQITFRPIEALLNAVEDGLSLNDDYQIKHNLCNLLFGS